jgi:hypothetical protein
MRRSSLVIRSALPALLILLAAAGARETAASDRIGPVEVISLSPQKAAGWRFGYIEHRVRLRNLSAEQTHTVEVVIPSERASHGGGGGIDRLARRVVLHPLDSAELSLPQPSRELNGVRRARITVLGQDAGNVFIPSVNTSLESYQNSLPVFVARRLNSDHLNGALTQGLAAVPAAAALSHHRYRSSHNPQATLTRAESGMAAWSPNWLAYSGYAAVALTAGEWEAAPAPVREALLRYGACGGLVLLVGQTPPPVRWILERQDVAGGSFLALGAGHWAITANSPENWTEEFRNRAALRLQEAARRWHTEFDVGEAHKIYPVKENVKVEAAGFFYMLLLFALLVGPALLFVLARKRRRIWLFWVVPTASLSASVLILAYSLISEGVTPHRRADTLVLLDQTRNEGTLLGLVGYYAPLTPGQGFRFAPETALAPFEVKNRWRRAGGTQPAWQIDHTRDQHWTAGFAQARVPAIAQVRKPLVARERLDIQESADGLVVVNGLGADIRALRVRATDGRWYEFGPLGAGRRAAPTPAAAPPDTAARPAAAVHAATQTEGWAAGLTGLRIAQLALEPGSYAAELSVCPFLERGLTGHLHNTERTVLIGRFAASPR